MISRLEIEPEISPSKINEMKIFDEEASFDGIPEPTPESKRTNSKIYK
jgi:hypothetical protein